MTRAFLKTVFLDLRALSVRYWRRLSLVALLGLFAAFYPMLKDIYDHHFAPIFRIQLLVVSYEPHFKLLNCGQTDWVKEDLDIAMYLRIANSSDTSREIVKYHVEAKTTRKWEPLHNITVPHRYSIGAINDDRLFIFDMAETSLDLAASGVIEPGHSIEGWAFFNAKLLPRDSSLFRVTLFDSHGHVKTLELSPEPLDPNQTFFRSAKFVIVGDDLRPRCQGK